MELSISITQSETNVFNAAFLNDHEMGQPYQLVLKITPFRTLSAPLKLDYLCVNSTKRRTSENQYREITTANWGLATTNQNYPLSTIYTYWLSYYTLCPVPFLCMKQLMICLQKLRKQKFYIILRLLSSR